MPFPESSWQDHGRKPDILSPSCPLVWLHPNLTSKTCQAWLCITHTRPCTKIANSKSVYLVQILWLNLIALKTGEALSVRESRNQLQRHLRHEWFFAALADCIACANMCQLISLKPYWIILSSKFCWKRTVDYLSPKMLLIRALLSNPILSY